MMMNADHQAAQSRADQNDDERWSSSSKSLANIRLSICRSCTRLLHSMVTFTIFGDLANLYIYILSKRKLFQ